MPTPLQTQTNQMEWTLEGDPQKPPQFKKVLVTVEGFDEACIAAMWKKEWFLINDFEQQFKGGNGAVKVIAWRELPAIYESR